MLALLLVSRLFRYWLRAPTGQEYIIDSLMGVNHGALGTVSWVDPTPTDIKMSGSELALSLPSLIPYIYSPKAAKANYLVDGVDIATWTVGEETLVIALNTNYRDASMEWSDVGLAGWNAKMVYQSGFVEVTPSGLTLASVSAGAFVVSLS